MSKKIIEKEAIIIPGSQKSGTTTLFNLLTRHPNIENPLIKEGQFFSLDKKTIENNLRWYENRFSEEKRYIIDASTFYLQSKRAPYNIKNYLKKSKIIIILRDPSKRAYSGYLHMNKKIKCADNRHFSKIVNRVKGPKVEDIINTENSFIQESIKNHKIDKDYIDKDYLKYIGVDFDSNFEDKLWPYKYFQNSLYSYHLKNYMSIFNNMKILFMEELIDKPEYILRDIFDYLELDSKDISFKIPRKNVTKVPRNEIARHLLYLLNLAKKFNNTNLIIEKMDFSYINRRLYKKPKISKNIYNKCKEILNNEYDYWLSKYKKLDKYWCY